MKRILGILILTSVLTLHWQLLFSQSAEWLVAPKYSKIEFLAPGLYKVVAGGKYGIVDNKGGIILSPEFDEIKPFYEGMAVFGDYQNEGFAIKGVLKENGEIYLSKGRFYLNPYYEFYSEGFIPVQDESGKYGYLDDKCTPVFRFTRHETRPFVDGLAPVGNGEDFYWLTSTGEPIFLTLKSGKIPYGGTNFYNGKAYLWDNDGQFYTMDEAGKISKANVSELRVDYLYRANSGKGEDVEYVEYKPLLDRMDLTPRQKNGLWSYVDSEGKPLAPFQYDHVGEFAEGIAIAAADGKWGLLHIVPDNSTFNTKVDKKRHVFSPGKDCKLEFRLSVPEKWEGQNLTVRVKDSGNGQFYDLMEKGDGLYQFDYKPSPNKADEERGFEVEVLNDDISLWRGTEVYSFLQRAKLLSSIRLNNAEANEDDICTVTATIKNPSSIPVTTTVSLTGGAPNAQFDGKTMTIEIPPHGSKAVTGIFHVKKVVLGGWCAVSTSDGSSARRDNIELKPH